MIWFDMIWYNVHPLSWFITVLLAESWCGGRGVSVILSKTHHTHYCLWTVYTPCADSPNNGLVCRAACLLSRGRPTHATLTGQDLSTDDGQRMGWQQRCWSANTHRFVLLSEIALQKSPVTPLTELQQESVTHCSITEQPCAQSRGGQTKTRRPNIALCSVSWGLPWSKKKINWMWPIH